MIRTEDDKLTEGEEVVCRAVIHWAIYWKSIAVLIVSAILAMNIFPLGVVLAVFGMLLFGAAAITKYILRLTLTNKRVLARYGVIQVDGVDLHFDKIESVELERMLPGFLLGYANVVIMGTGNRYIVIPYVGNAEEFRAAYNEQALNDKK